MMLLRRVAAAAVGAEDGAAAEVAAIGGNAKDTECECECEPLPLAPPPPLARAPGPGTAASSRSPSSSDLLRSKRRSRSFSSVRCGIDSMAWY